MPVDRQLLIRVNNEGLAREAAYQCPVIAGLKVRFADWRKKPSWTGRATQLIGNPIRGEATLRARHYLNCCAGEFEAR